jgi:hypothetical protein
MLRPMVPQPKPSAADQGELAARFTAALDKLLPPGMGPRIIEDALARAQLNVVPEDAVGLVFFATGPLHEAVEEARGEQLASAVLGELGPVLDEAWVRERRRVAADPDSGLPPLSTSDMARSAVPRSAVPRSAVPRNESGVRRQEAIEDVEDVEDETPTDVERMIAADTIPAPAFGTAEAAAADLALGISSPPQTTDPDDD